MGAVRGSAVLMTGVLWLGAAAFGILLYAGYDFIIGLLYGGKFDLPRSVLLVGCTIPFASALIATSSAVLRSLEAVRALFVGYLVATLAAAPFVAAALERGTVGSAIGAQAVIIVAVSISLAAAAAKVVRGLADGERRGAHG